MNVPSRLTAITLTAILALTACSARISSLPTQRLADTSSAVTVRLLIGANGVHSTSRARTPRFVSAATLGVDLRVLSGATLITEIAVDVSPGSAACGGSTGSPRTCTGTTGFLAAGTYTLTATTYDQKPVAGAIPGTAHALATSTVSGVVVANRTDTNATIYVGGIINGFGAPGFVSLSADGTAHLVGFALAPTDYANEPITAGVNDPYANPITLTLSETGGTGHATLQLNGSNVGTTAVVNRSSDAVQVAYDGAGAPGYYATITLAASGTTSTNVTIAPMFVSPSAYNVGRTINFFAAGQQSTLAITEANAPGTTTYATTPTGCTNIITVGGVSGAGSSANVTITDATTALASGCSVAITDNAGTSTSVPVAFTNTLTSATTTVPGQFAEYPMTGTAPDSIQTGPDGRLWFTEFSSNKLGAITVNGSLSEYPIAGSNPSLLCVGSDGRLWYAEQSAIEVGAMTTAGVAVHYPTNSPPLGTTLGPDARVWFSQSNSNFGAMTPSGSYTEYVTPWTSLQPSIALGPDGRIWAIAGVPQKIVAYGTGYNGSTLGSLAAYGSFSGGANITRITAGPDGAIWFTENGASKVGRITTAGVITEYSLPLGASSPNGVLAGADGNVWVAEGARKRIARIGTGANGTTLGSITEYVGTAATGFTAQGSKSGAIGPDGNLWFLESTPTSNVLRFTP
jgi:streptogramin lyase